MALEIGKSAPCGGPSDNLCCLLHATLAEDRMDEGQSE